jgi:hypothetical protein
VIAASSTPRTARQPAAASLWWALALGAGLGGNATVVGIAARQGYPDLVLALHPPRPRRHHRDRHARPAVLWLRYVVLA